jgi:hypothetical protein
MGVSGERALWTGKTAGGGFTGESEGWDSPQRGEGDSMGDSEGWNSP